MEGRRLCSARVVNEGENRNNIQVALSLSYGFERCNVHQGQAVVKKTSLAIFCCCTADSQTDAGRHQLYNNGLLALPLLDHGHGQLKLRFAFEVGAKIGPVNYGCLPSPA